MFNSYSATLREKGTKLRFYRQNEGVFVVQQQPPGSLNTTYDRVTTINAFGLDPNEFIGELPFSLTLPS